MTTIAKLTILCVIFCVLIFSPGFVWAQETAEEQTAEAPSRGAIPEELLRPRREEAPRYAADTVIGNLGQGSSPLEAYRFARRIATALTAGNINADSLASMNKASLENYLSTLEIVNPRNFRLGSGREESDGSVSFLVRFIGPEQAMTGELYVRDRARTQLPPEPTPAEDGEEAQPAPVARAVWVFEDLILEDAKNKDGENPEPRFDFSPYQRFF